MHMLIYALVEADSADDARATAAGAFDRLVGAHDTQAGQVFDYYVTFDDDSSPVAGPARWGDLPVAARLDTEAGARLLYRGWSHTVGEFERLLDQVREGLATLSDDQVMHDVDLVRHSCYELGRYRGPPLALYDEYGAGIRDRARLDQVLAGLDTDWIVPADVHF